MNKDLKEIKVSAREQKNLLNKQKLYDAAEEIMNTYDYNTVTIRNICKVSGVSYGSFYNLFQSKEEFLRFYLTNDFTQYINEYFQRNDDFLKLNEIEKSIEIFVCCARYNIKKGVHFVSSFYSTKNYSLFLDKNNIEKGYSFTPLVKLGQKYLLEAQEQGDISHDKDIKEMICMYCYFFNGITFNWCLSKGSLDIVYLTKKYYIII